MDESAKNKIVIDSSFVLSFLLPDEDNSEVKLYFTKFQTGMIDFISSPLLFFEVFNGFVLALKRKRVDKKYCINRLQELLDYNIEVSEINLLETFSLSQEHNLTFYDASYLYLSKSQHLPLLTLDKHLLPFSLSPTS